MGRARPGDDREAELLQRIGDRRADRAVAEQPDGALLARREASPFCPSMLRFEPRQVPQMSQHHERDVLRHTPPLQWIDCANDGHVRRNVAGRQQLVCARTRARDQAQIRKSRRDACREAEGDDGLDSVGGRGVRVGVEALVGRQSAQRRELVLHEARSGEEEDRHGRAALK